MNRKTPSEKRKQFMTDLEEIIKIEDIKVVRKGNNIILYDENIKSIKYEYELVNGGEVNIKPKHSENKPVIYKCIEEDFIFPAIGESIYSQLIGEEFDVTHIEKSMDEIRQAFNDNVSEKPEYWTEKLDSLEIANNVILFYSSLREILPSDYKLELTKEDERYALYLFNQQTPFAKLRCELRKEHNEWNCYFPIVNKDDNTEKIAVLMIDSEEVEDESKRKKLEEDHSILYKEKPYYTFEELWFEICLLFKDTGIRDTIVPLGTRYCDKHLGDFREKVEEFTTHIKNYKGFSYQTKKIGDIKTIMEDDKYE